MNVVSQGDDVYVDGKKAATAKAYSRQAIALANEPVAPPPPPTPVANEPAAEPTPTPTSVANEPAAPAPTPPSPAKEPAAPAPTPPSVANETASPVPTPASLPNEPIAPASQTIHSKPGQQLKWLPFGVWALAQEEKGDAKMFFQLSINRDGVLSGAYQNVLTGEKSPVSGQVDKKTQRVAWKIENTNTVIETGLRNLTQHVTSCLVHFGPDSTQTWLLVRLKQPEIPNALQMTAEQH